MHFKIDWASLIVGMKFTIFALLCFALEGNFQVQAPRGLVLGLYFGGEIYRRVFCVTSLGGLIFGAVYTWRGLFSEFYGNQLVDGKGKHVGSAVVL